MAKPLLLSVSIVAALLCMLLSEVSSPRYLALVVVALAFAIAHFTSGALFLRRARSPAKWLLLVLVFPVLVFAIDDFGRLLSLLGLPSFRVLI